MVSLKDNYKDYNKGKLKLQQNFKNDKEEGDGFSFYESGQIKEKKI